MFELLCLLTGVVLAAGAAYAFWMIRDAFHPAIATAPLFIYVYSVWPTLLNANYGLEVYASREALVYTATVYLITISAFVAGLVNFNSSAGNQIHSNNGVFNVQINKNAQKKIYQLAVFLGLIASAAYWYAIDNVGGFVAAYSRAKGGGYAGSGYIGEAQLLAYPALLMLAISRRGIGRISASDVVLAFVIISPHLLQGTFGGRRGPLFLTLCILFFSWFVASGKKPKLRTMMIGIVTIAFTVALVWSQRQNLYIGSDGNIDSGSFYSKIIPDDVAVGNTYLFGVGLIQSTDYHESYYWGFRYFVTFVIRPIPRQIWPTKYEDVGATWVMGIDEESKDAKFEEATGFLSPNGSAAPSIADAYVEVWWGVVVLFYLVGRGFSLTWSRHRAKGGVWTILYLVMLILSIYLATQSFSAWAHRLMFIAIPTVVVWKIWIEPSPRNGHRILVQ
ncbi:MAG: O-antigen polymerase [Pseudomonadota bacterium]